MASANPLPEVLPDTDTETKTRRQPPYAVILHNDDINTIEFVVEVLRKVFGYPVEKCVELTIEAHEKGRAIVWIGSLEVAELKADQIHSCGPDPHQKSKGAQPLGVSVEPVA
ncbi:MAG TPA: ATP-dependent Clp protease adaptor ClpS [Gemmata sp.]|jgi:ATP-dependent Clp protease adaptor protein ClpS|nr:ATP-dependent Clp protease adaptor ClpS [Gemmata sp.]